MTSVLITGSVPIVAAPMAGGPTTVALARAVAGAGGLPYLAGGYQTAESLRDQIGQLRAAVRAPYGVNLAHHNPGCRRDLKPPVSSRDLAM